MLEMMTSSILKKITEPGSVIDPEVFQKLIPSDGAYGDNFGISLTISENGSTIVVGAPLDDDKGTDSGSVYIFTKQANGSYLQTQKLVASDGKAGNKFGQSVAVSSDGFTIVVGAPINYGKNIESGSVYIFTKQTNESYLQTQKLIASDGTIGDQFGHSVAVSSDGSTIIVGAIGDDDKGNNSGTAYVFKKQANESYLETQKLVASDGASDNRFGRSFAISSDGSTIVVGAPYNSGKVYNTGSVYIFTKQANGSYLQTQKLVASDGAGGERFGWSVTTSGDGSTIVVGAYLDDDKGVYSGSVYIFTKQANGSYLQIQKLVAADGARDDEFGSSVAVSGDGSIIIVGAYGDDDKGFNLGSAYVFTKQADDSYFQSQKLVPSDGKDGDYFGISIAISQTSVVVITNKHLDIGSAYVF